jgi:hypothetical protein
MDASELRLKCLEAAVQSPVARANPSNRELVVNLASEFYNFVIQGDDPPSNPVEKKAPGKPKKADKPTDILS